MIKKSIKKIVNSLGYDIVKKYDSGHVPDAIMHNKLDNVNKKNQDINHFIKNLTNDSIFIECIFGKIDKLYLDTMKFIDVGCGSGVLVNKLKTKYTKGNIQGCDFSEVKMIQCQKYYKKEIFFVHDISTNLKEKYNFIVCTEVLEHLKYPEKAICNLVNALEDNGLLFITVPNGRLDTFKGHIHFWSSESFKLFIESNIKDENVSVNFSEHCSKNTVLIKKGKM